MGPGQPGLDAGPRGQKVRPRLLVVDAGATRTRAMVVSPDGCIRGEGRAGPANAFAVGDELALTHLLLSVRRALVSAKSRGKEISAAVIGSASVDTDGSGRAPVEGALRRRLSRARVRVVADSLIALEGALLGEGGVAIVSGTGSVVLGRNARGEMVKIGGWGPLIGDEGSAQWLGRQALRAAAQACDGTGPATALLANLRRHFRLRSFARIVDAVYQHRFGPAELGALAPLVARAAQRGDGVALEIFRRAGQALATQAARAAKRLGMKQARVSYQGSVFRAGRILLDPLRKSLERLAPRATLVEPALPPIGGAFLLALRCLKVEASSEALAAFRRHFHD